MRLVTKGDPHKILERLGTAKNLLSRNITKERIDGIPQRRAYGEGVEVRLDAQGIDQMIMDVPAKKLAEIVPEQAAEPYSKVMIYAAGELSATSMATLSERSLRYWSSSLPSSIIDVINCKTIVIADPQRILTDAEAKVINLLLSKGRNVFVFPGADTAVYNAILLQLGSNLQLIPMSAAQGKLCVITADTRTLYRLPVLRRGFLHPIKDHTLTAVISDPMGKMMATSGVVVMAPTFYYTSSVYGGATPFTYSYGSELLDLLQSDDENEEDVILTFTRNSYIPETIYPDDWTTLSESDVVDWLNTLSADFFKLCPDGYTPPKDADGWQTYADKGTYDNMGAYAAYEVGKNLYVFGFSPYWMIADYVQAYDAQTDVIIFCQWMEETQNVSEGAFGSVFYPLEPFYYTYTTKTGGYYPPIQS